MEPGPSTNGTTVGSAEGNVVDDTFIRHKITKLDTLAGLAVKYNVTVADIKRANGLLSDNSMFARDFLAIPTQRLPLGTGQPAWSGLASQNSRLYGKSRRKHKGTAALQRLRGYYSTGPSMCESAHSSDDEASAAAATTTARRQPREVELMTRSSGAASVSSYIEEKLRRRKAGGSFDEEDEDDEEEAPGPRPVGGGNGDAWAYFGRPPLFRSTTDGRSGRWKDSLLKSLKKVSSQPALLVPPPSGPALPPPLVMPAGAVSATAASPGQARASGSRLLLERAGSSRQLVASEAPPSRQKGGGKAD